MWWLATSLADESDHVDVILAGIYTAGSIALFLCIIGSALIAFDQWEQLRETRKRHFGGV